MDEGKTEVRSQEPAPEVKTFGALALRLAVRFTDTLHVSASGITMFVFYGLARALPTHREVFEGLAELAAVYLFGASVAKK